MKSSELHRKILKAGWVLVRSRGSHYIYEKDGRRYVVPYHGAGEIYEPLRKKIEKEMEL